MSCMMLPFHDFAKRRVDALPLRQKLLKNQLSVPRQRVKALVTLIFLAPLADQETLSFQSAKQRIEGAFINGHPMFSERLAQGVAVLFRAQLGQHRKDQRPAPQLGPEILEDVGVAGHILCAIYCTIHSKDCQEKFYARFIFLRITCAESLRRSL